MFALAAINEGQASDRQRTVQAPSTVSVEAQEARLACMYEEALELQQNGRWMEAQVQLQTLLEDPLVADAKATGVSASTLMQLKFLAYKNLAALDASSSNAEAQLAALRYYVAAAQLDAGDVVLWHHLGTLAMRLGRLNVARLAFENALKLSPQHWPCLQRLCEVLYALGDDDACMATVNAILQLDPHHARAHTIRQTLQGRASGDVCYNIRAEKQPAPVLSNLQAARSLRESHYDGGEVLIEPKRMCITRLTWATLCRSLLDAASEKQRQRDSALTLYSTPVLLSIAVTAAETIDTDIDKASMQARSLPDVVTLSPEHAASPKQQECSDAQTENEETTTANMSSLPEPGNKHSQDELALGIDNKSMQPLEPAAARKRRRGESLETGRMVEARSTRSRKQQTPQETAAPAEEHNPVKDLFLSLVKLMSTNDATSPVSSPDRAARASVPTTNGSNAISPALREQDSSQGVDVSRFVESVAHNSGIRDVMLRLMEELAANAAAAAACRADDILCLDECICDWVQGYSLECSVFLSELYLDKQLQSPACDQAKSVHLAAAQRHLGQALERMVEMKDDGDGQYACRADSLEAALLIRYHWACGRFDLLCKNTEDGVAHLQACARHLQNNDMVDVVSLPYCKRDAVISSAAVEKKLRVGSLPQMLAEARTLVSQKRYTDAVKLMVKEVLQSRAGVLDDEAMAAINFLKQTCVQAGMECLAAELRCYEQQLLSAIFSTSATGRQHGSLAWLDWVQDGSVMHTDLPAIASGLHPEAPLNAEQLLSDLNELLERIRALGASLGSPTSQHGTQTLTQCMQSQDVVKHITRLMRITMLVISSATGEAKSSNGAHATLLSRASCLLFLLHRLQSSSTEDSVMMVDKLHVVLATNACCCENDGEFLLTASSELLSQVRTSTNISEDLQDIIKGTLRQVFWCLHEVDISLDQSPLQTHTGAGRVPLDSQERCANLFRLVREAAASAPGKVLQQKWRSFLLRVYSLFPQPPDEVMQRYSVLQSMDDATRDHAEFAAATLLPTFSEEENDPRVAGPFADVYRDLYYLVHCANGMEVHDLDACSLTADPEDEIKLKPITEPLLFDLAYHPDRFESWRALGASYDSTVDLVLNDNSRAMSVTEWAVDNRRRDRAVEVLRRRCRHCLLQASLLARSDAEKIAMQELLGETLYDAIQNVPPMYDQHRHVVKHDTLWRAVCEQAQVYFTSAAAVKPDEWSYHFYLGKLAEKLNRTDTEALQQYAVAVSTANTLLEPLYRLHSSRLKLLCTEAPDLSAVRQHMFLDEASMETGVDDERALLFADCIAAMEFFLERDKYFHKARHRLAAALLWRGIPAEVTRALELLSMFFKKENRIYINLWEVEASRRKAKKLRGLSTTQGRPGSLELARKVAKDMTIGKSESSRKFIGCVRKYLLLYIYALARKADQQSLDTLALLPPSLGENKKFARAVEDIVPIALAVYTCVLASAIARGQAGNAQIDSHGDLKPLLEKAFVLYAEHAHDWSTITQCVEQLRLPVRELAAAAQLHISYPAIRGGKQSKAKHSSDAAVSVQQAPQGTINWQEVVPADLAISAEVFHDHALQYLQHLESEVMVAELEKAYGRLPKRARGALSPQISELCRQTQASLLNAIAKTVDRNGEGGSVQPEHAHVMARTAWSLHRDGLALPAAQTTPEPNTMLETSTASVPMLPHRIDQVLVKLYAVEMGCEPTSHAEVLQHYDQVFLSTKSRKR
eukprot:jgi/Chlat1/7235/Chrsp58S06868